MEWKNWTTVVSFVFWNCLSNINFMQIRNSKCLLAQRILEIWISHTDVQRAMGLIYFDAFLVFSRTKEQVSCPCLHIILSFLTPLIKESNLIKPYLNLWLLQTRVALCWQKMWLKRKGKFIVQPNTVCQNLKMA